MSPGTPFYDAVRSTDPMQIRENMDRRGLVPVWDYSVAASMKGEHPQIVAKKAISWKTPIDAREILYQRTGCIAKPDMTGPMTPDPSGKNLEESERAARIASLEAELAGLRDATMGARPAQPPTPLAAEQRPNADASDVQRSPAGKAGMPLGGKTGDGDDAGAPGDADDHAEKAGGLPPLQPVTEDEEAGDVS